MTTPTEIIEKLDAAREQLDKVVGGLSEAQIATASTVEDWSVKDHIAHLAVWAKGMVALLHKEPRWEAMGLSMEYVKTSPGYDAMNALIYEQYRHHTWSQVHALFAETHQAIKDTLPGMTEADLQQPYTNYQPQPGKRFQYPVVEWVIGNTYEHYLEHLPWILARIERDRAGDANGSTNS
jgi:hypothetical protein